jgi:hypothetical protein
MIHSAGNNGYACSHRGGCWITADRLISGRQSGEADVTGDETAEVRLLDLRDFPYADDIAGDDSTARILVDLPPEGAARDAGTVQVTPEKTINIQQGAGISRARVKLSAAGGSWGAATWRIVRHDGTLAIRVDLESSPQQLPNLSMPTESPGAETPEVTPHWILWVVLEPNEARDSNVPPGSPVSSSGSRDPEIAA